MLWSFFTNLFKLDPSTDALSHFLSHGTKIHSFIVSEEASVGASVLVDWETLDLLFEHKHHGGCGADTMCVLLTIVNCGSSDKCLAADGTCKDVTDDGPYLSKNMVDCTDDESEEWDHTDDNNGLDWAGVGPAPTMAPIPAPNATCISSYQALAAPVKAAMDAHKDDESKCPLIELACPPPAGQLDIKATSKEALIGYLGAFFATAAVCPPVCYPGSETHLDNGEQDTHGICTTSAMMLMLEQQVKGFPIYQNTGTNGRFLANNEAMDLCTMTKEVAKGIGAGIKLE
jgi:hypothetical protein